MFAKCVINRTNINSKFEVLSLRILNAIRVNDHHTSLQTDCDLLTPDINCNCRIYGSFTMNSLFKHELTQNKYPASSDMDLKNIF